MGHKVLPWLTPDDQIPNYPTPTVTISTMTMNKTKESLITKMEHSIGYDNSCNQLDTWKKGCETDLKVELATFSCIIQEQPEPVEEHEVLEPEEDLEENEYCITRIFA